MKIAILGATSHIAKGLISRFFREAGNELSLFVRNKDKLVNFLTSINYNNDKIFTFDQFGKHEYDVVINCVGFGTPEKVKSSSYEIFRVTEYYDNMILDYISKNTETLYINFSSGAVYGKDFSKPVGFESQEFTAVNSVTSEDFYRLAKLNSEVKHRSYNNLKIVDIRVFGYLSEFIDTSSRFLFTEILHSIKNNEVFNTSGEDIIRDYVYVDDLFEFIKLSMQSDNQNTVYDVYSSAPVSKFNMLDHLNNKYGLKYKINNVEFINATGLKSNYYSEMKTNDFNYLPKYSSLDSIDKTLSLLIGEK